MRFCSILFLFLAGCGPKSTAPGPTSGPLRVIASTYPLQYLAARIGGKHIQATCPVPADSDPAIWMPDKAMIQRLQAADLILLNGAGFESWPDKVSLPDSRVLDSSAPLKANFIHYKGITVHSHGPEGEHAHEGLDGHTWLDPLNAKTQASEIQAALSRTRPAYAKAFAAKFAALSADLDALDRALRALSSGPLLASHPAYNYLARRYNWDIRNLDLDPEIMPNPEAITAINSLLREHPAKQLLWESSPATEIANHIQTETGLTSIVFSPCETQPDGQDYLTVMRENIAALAR